MKLSIVIPAFNVEQYLEKCLDCCLNQDGVKLGEDYEIIVVDDGSPDRSGEIAENILSGKPGGTVIHQQNKGLSMARNNGMAKAKGEYVWFVDSDDWIAENCLNDIIKKLNGKPDILQLKYLLVYEDGVTEEMREKIVDWDGILTGKELLSRGGLPFPAQFMIYRREFLLKKQLQFASGRLHEDMEFKPRAIYLAKSIALYSTPVYYYLQRTSGSITSSFSFKNAEDFMFAINSLQSFKESYVTEPIVKKYFDNLAGLMINSILAGYKKVDKKQKREIAKLLRQDKRYLKSMGNASSVKYRMEGLLMMLNLRFALFIYNHLM